MPGGPTPFTHLALIRGINVGGNNVVRMAELRDALDARGIGPVETYIQSGNVLVRAAGMSAQDVAAEVVATLAETFGIATTVLAVPIDALEAAAAEAPHGFGDDPDTYRYDVIFLMPSLPVADAWAVVTTRDGVDDAWRGSAVIYLRRLSAEAGKSYLPKLVSTPEYQRMTIRNWKTTTALVELAAKAGSAA